MRGFTQRVWKQVERLTRVGGLTLAGVFRREKVNPPTRVTLARPLQNKNVKWLSSA